LAEVLLGVPARRERFSLPWWVGDFAGAIGIAYLIKWAWRARRRGGTPGDAVPDLDD
jgi:hypothetical protein